VHAGISFRADTPARAAPPRGPRSLPPGNTHLCLVEEAGVARGRMAIPAAFERVRDLHVWWVHDGSYPRALPPHSELEPLVRDVRRIVDGRARADAEPVHDDDLLVLVAASLLEDVQPSYLCNSSRLVTEALAAAQEILAGVTPPGRD
jgi:hypothetical protein